MKDTAELRKALVEHLQDAMSMANKLHEGALAYLIGCALDEARKGDSERLREGLR